MPPTGKVLWARKRHTQAKHQVLVDYLAAWIPILATQGGDLIFIDGFAGPGTYEDGEKGSPLLMLDAYARRADRAKLAITAHFYFIEQHAGRAAALRAQIDKRKKVPDIEVEVIEGDYDVQFPALLDRLRHRWPRDLPPIFAFIDPFGAQDRQVLTSRLLRLPRCEALIFVPMGHFARFVEHPDVEETLDALFGTPDWREARHFTDLDSRLRVLVNLFRRQLEQSARWSRAIEIVPADRNNTHFLFFGTSNRKGLAKMKEAMWKLDPVSGQRFQDSSNVDHPVLFEPEPNVAPLKQMLRDHFGTRPFTIEEAEGFTLFETPFRHDAHLKRETLTVAERAGELAPVDPKPDRRKCTYPKGTRVRFVDEGAKDGDA
jgi:three-Cys-motif partner protein